MYTIGEFAAFGHVSVRMLRHYDAIGLLTPARVDVHSGYRLYHESQLGELLRIVELRDLGCSLEDAAAVLRADDGTATLRSVLVRRRAELAASLADDAARLSRLDARLSTLEGAPLMTSIEYRRIEPVTVYAASGIARGMGPENVTPLVDEILPPLIAALDAAGVEYREPGIFWYEEVEGSEDLRVTVSMLAGDDPREGDGYAIVELPAIERAAVTTYRGDMPGIGRAWNEFSQAIAAAGHRFVGACREVYLESEPLPQSEWVTELQQPVA
ncbi:MerR family transcriptional regulator [Microbacterium ulmi]|uniref:MerR family transcriptional regulator n=2 Tax=Microbacterium ulmi TaxID=179095 RepID=A0A7Y2M552_9MICO|nr:MerR family transcriptional regulator [Microbacterium ulmi]NNH05268.1 MerR family transcriptional regulator [Microbacterium ulmi]